MSIYPTDSLFELMDFVSTKKPNALRGGDVDEQPLYSVLTGSFDEGIAFRGSGEAAASASSSVAPDMAAGSIHGDGVGLLSSVVGTNFKPKQVDGRVLSSMLDAMLQVGNVEYGEGGPMQTEVQQPPPGIQQQPQFLELPAPPPQPPVAAVVAAPGMPQLALPAPPPPPPPTDLVPYIQLQHHSTSSLKSTVGT